MSEIVPIHVAFAADENYAQHLGVAMMSLLHNINPDRLVQITVIGDNLSAESISRLKQIAMGNNVSIAFPEVDFQNFDKLKVVRYLTRASFARFALPDIIEEDKVLYLDCDVLVRADISALWEVDVSGYYSGAISDTYVNSSSGQSMIDQRIGLSVGEYYFNCGVLLLNLEKCRREKVMERAYSFNLHNPGLFFMDQDALNNVMAGKYLILHPRWNVQIEMFNMCYNRKRKSEIQGEIMEAVKDPAIVHFTSPFKPWHYECYLPYVDEYYKYLALTPWKGYQSTGWTFQRMLKKVRRKIKRQLVGKLLGYRV